MTPLLPQGLADGLPPAADVAAALEARVLGAMRLFGYERADPPLAEYADALAARLKAGALTDAVRFVDPVSQRTLAIRPDITAQIARIAATRMAHHPRPVRLSYAGMVLKLRAAELSPARQMRQIGCELIGLDTVAAAREVVRVAVDALAAAGARDVSIDLTLPDLVDTLAAGALPVADRDTLRDRLDAKDAGAVATIAPEYLPLIAAAGPFASALERLRAFDTQGALSSRLDGLAAVVAGLPGEVALTLDPTERHGFEYQSWLGFSLFAGGREVGRGGTYTIMHGGEEGGGAEEVATGFSLYADALLGEVAAPERRRLFLPFGTTDADGGRLRAEGWVTVVALEPGDTPEAQLATHLWVDGQARPL